MSASQPTASEAAEIEQPYTGTAQLFHWVVVVLLVMQILTKVALPSLLPASAEDQLNAWHLSLGSTILLVMALRLAWRLTHPPPPPPADLATPLKMLSRATHWAFYAILIVLPLLGWIAASAYGAPVRLFGLIPLPALAAPDKELGETVGEMHGALAFTLLVVMALHIAGVLYHAFAKRDRMLHGMLPR